ncbi:glycine betaine ABC transporter substrate-binding protein [Bombella sp. TMW 2.2559]|uniref:Glycine betaine ABC transporter substrate-binding protein n=1 Tax=Bombella dulcis TaxID=2967339 RepID=A0ABT3WBZ1_9PROT|nr:glycine betaine ABC transporter substrate-binding protein [Bombella dulcis]MCX5615795.1 glycine betaine ABC transporter substrate-binding protein [Bombella dulcis]
MSYLTIGHLYTALHAACASGVARVIEANGENVAYADLGYDERLQALDDGEIDLLVSAWFPRDEAVLSHGHEVIGSLYHPELNFSALKKAGKGNRRWDAGEFSSLVMTADARPFVENAFIRQPDLKVLPLDIVATEEILPRLQQDEANGKCPLVAVWQPHAVFHTDMLENLSDGDLLDGQTQTARLVLRKGLRDEVDEDMIDELSIMMLSNKVMSALDHAVSIEGMGPEEAAESWQRGRLIPR